MRAFIATLATTIVQAGKYEAVYSNFMEKRLTQMSNNQSSPIQITLDGEQVTKYIASNACHSDGANFICPEGGRGYLINSETFDASKPDFFQVNLLGGSVEWDVDLSSFECGCINTFYTTSMPGKDQNGNLDITDGYFYCDAMAVEGNFCPELDLMDANKHAIQTTPHPCEEPNEQGYYWKCKRAGTYTNSVDDIAWDGYGAGEWYTINTNKPIHVKVEIIVTTGIAAEIKTTISQNGNAQYMKNTNSWNIYKMTEALKSQVFVVSNWSGDD